MAIRHNLCPNPACKNDTTGWGGNSTFTRTTTITGMLRTTGINWTGNGFSQPPTGVCAPGDVFTVSFQIKNNTGFTVGPRTVYVSYTRTSGGDVFPETFTVTPGATGSIVRGFFTTAAAPALANGIYLVIDQLNGAGGSFDITAVLYEKVAALDTYFDGDTTPGGSWDGTPGNSTSSLSSIITYSLGLPIETDTALQLSRRKIYTLGTVGETETALSVIRKKIITLGAIGEQDSPLPLLLPDSALARTPTHRVRLDRQKFEVDLSRPTYKVQLDRKKFDAKLE